MKNSSHIFFVLFCLALLGFGMYVIKLDSESKVHLELRQKAYPSEIKVITITGDTATIMRTEKGATTIKIDKYYREYNLEKNHD